MAPRKLLDFFFLCFSFFFLLKFSVVVFADNNNNNNVSFNFPSFTLRNLTLLGDSYLRNGVIGLTRELGVPSSSSGTVVYNNPVQFFDQETNTTASFSTRFSFSINNVNPSSYGDGLAFFMSPDNQILGSPGGYLGLVNSSQLTKNRFVAVEFDTRIDSHFDDPDENHVGLDIDSLNSIKTADPISQGIDLKSGNLITTWIDYKNDLRVLKVFMSYTTSKPEKPVLTVDVDLSEYLKEVMYIGFSASTEGSTELHLIEDWSFRSFGFLPVRSRLHPHNVSDSSVTTVPDLPIANSTNKHHHKIGLGFGIAGPAFFCVVLAVFGYISVKKWKGMRIAKGQKTELVAGPREFSYKDLHQATKGFHSSRILGRGAFGNVYKAFFVSSGSIAAVKRSKHSHEAGTMGYLAPEYLQYGKATEKTDVFSYGVVVLEVACGRRPIERELNGQKMVNLVDWVWGLYAEGRIIEAADKKLNGEFEEEEMKKLLLLGLSCANPDSSERPSMRRVLQLLNGEAEPAFVPKMKPSLTFSSMSLNIEDIVSDDSDED
ncbi:hypothetical protein LWI28_000018 [Acer negundo]|uniref:non-specific serine/threonine protein kinase n=1 Tax=Acer negundo TaxID=4023 RepID=A0AAD5J203_ACENE|nr:hypothetical protein LWI28_000018 [Acer negundo]